MDEVDEAARSESHVVIITGMSGAGRSHTADVLEDLQYFVVDNLPVDLIVQLVERSDAGDGSRDRVAVVVDTRGGVTADELSETIKLLRQMDYRTTVLFLDADDRVLIRRFEESRRPHPVAAPTLDQAIALERATMLEIRGLANLIVDTSNLNVHELGDRLRNAFARGLPERRMQIDVTSFGFKHGVPRVVDLLFDARFLPNPHWQPELRSLTGIDPAVSDYVFSHDEAGEFLEKVVDLLDYSLFFFGAEVSVPQPRDVDVRIFAPHVCDGPIKERQLTYRQNDLVKTGRNVKYEVLTVPDLTQPIAVNREHFSSQVQKLSGTDKALSGEPFGSRTTATESKNIFDAAMMPLDEKASYIADQLFPWMYEWDAAMWRHWADPKLKLSLTGAHNPIEVMPSQLWGPIRTKVTAVTRFHNTTVERQQINTAVQNLYPMSEQYMAAEGRTEFWADLYTMMGLDGAKYFPQGGDYDATRMATNEAYSMLQGQWVEPDPNENQGVHQRVIDSAVSQYSIAPNRDENILRMLKEHQELHRQMAQQQKAGIAQQQQGGQQPALGTGGQPQLEGEATGDLTEALEGAQAGGF